MIHSLPMTLRGLTTCVPKALVDNGPFTTDPGHKKLVESIGVRRRRIAGNETSLDLCLCAAKDLMKKISWHGEDIDLVLFVSQTPNYQIPSSSPLVQQALKLKNSTLCIDINQGCSGFVHGLMYADSLLQGFKLKKALLLCGDTISKVISPSDISTQYYLAMQVLQPPLSGMRAGTPALFSNWIDGSGSRDIMIRPPEGSSADAKAFLQLNGANVFSFAISKVPQAIKSFLTETQLEISGHDFFAFHQANQMINQMLNKKLSLEPARVLDSIRDFGNTSSASIPLSISRHGDSISGKILLAGFGVGLSIAVGSLDLNNVPLGQVIYE